MNAKEKQSLRERMEEASLLSPGDSERQQVEALVAQADESIREEWSQWLHLNEQLRLSLLSVVPPAGFEDRLLRLPETCQPAEEPKPSTSMWRQRWGWSFAAALLVLCVVSIIGWLRFSSTSNQLNHRLQQLVWLAVSDHLKRPRLDIKTSRWEELSKQIKKQLPFSPQHPRLSGAIHLRGGRKCYLARRAVLLSRWQDQHADYTLFQFRPRDFQLPIQIAATQRRPLVWKELPGQTSARLWTQNRTGFILVREHVSSHSLP